MSQSNKEKGFIALYRSLQDSYLWSDKPFARGQAWIDLLFNANHKDNKTYIDGALVVVKRGEKVTSLRQLSDSWGWSRTKVKKFLNELQEDGMIVYESDNKKTTYKVLNYGAYQDLRLLESATEKPQKDIKNDTERIQKDIKKNSKKIQKNTNNHDNHDNHDNHSLCTELSRDSSMLEEPAEKIAISLPLNDGTLHGVKVDEVSKWEQLYPNVNVMQELRMMVGWSDANPTKRKTKRGINRFITNWLSGKQDKGSKPQSGYNGNYKKVDNTGNFTQRDYTKEEYDSVYVDIMAADIGGKH